MGGDVPVTVTIEGGVIVDVEVGDNSETQGIGSKAIEQLPDAIVAANGIEGVEGVSGASVTSGAIFEAVRQALEAASSAGSGNVAAAAENTHLMRLKLPATHPTRPSPALLPTSPAAPSPGLPLLTPPLQAPTPTAPTRAPERAWAETSP